MSKLIVLLSSVVAFNHLVAAEFSGSALAKTNGAFCVEWDVGNGGLKSLVLNNDTNRMNWIEGTGTWGTIRSYDPKIEFPSWEDSYFNPQLIKFEGMSIEGDEVVSHYVDGDVAVAVRRRLDGDSLHESYEFTNKGYAPRYYLRGHLGILATFNDSYHSAKICCTQRCHAHIHAHGKQSFVHALKMAPYDTELVLSMTDGALDGYSVRRIMKEYSNDRGDFVLHTEPFELLKGETRKFAWKVSSIKAGTFVPPVRVKYETCFPGEEFEIVDSQGTHRVKAEKPGELEAFGARLYVSPELDKVVENCIRFIVRKLQCRDPKSPLYGAFLLYDDETGRQYFDNRFSDHNATRERIGMGLLLARWLQTHKDAEVQEAFDLFEKFMFREFIDLESGVVYNTIGKNPNQKRLYNGPCAAEVLLELYALHGDIKYLETIKRVFLDFYANGGKKFYPNGGDISRAISLMEKAGMDVAKLKREHREHIDNVLANDIYYPEHEVRFEQTIVTPAVRLLAGYWLYLDKDPKVLEGLRRQIAMLERFDGDQPDHINGGTPIRHWDGYWFGKTHLYGDTLQYLSALSGNAYMLYYRVTGDERWREKAGRCFRNLLYLYREDGFGSAAYFVPHTVTMLKPDGTEIGQSRRGEKFDEFSNDQYGALHQMLKNIEAFQTSTVVRTNVWSSAMGKQIPVAYVLPSAYAMHPERKWPVAYLLHGCGGDANQFIEKTGLVRKAVDEGGFIAVCPDGMSSSWWMDSPIDDNVRYDTFVAKELVAWTDANFRTKTSRGDRAIAGASMGGYGAMTIGIRHKDVFGSIGTIFGCLELSPFLDKGWSIDKRMGALAGHEELYDRYSAINIAKTLKNGDVKLMMVIGTDDQFFVPCNRAMHDLLVKNGVEHSYAEIRGNDWLSSSHSFECQRFCEPFIFRFLAECFNR